MSSFNPVGPQGQPGPQGPAGQVSVASTQTGEAGTNAQVVNVGTTTNAQLAFTIPRGDLGDTGPMGPIGPKGEPGDLADRAATVVPGSTVALTITDGDMELQIPSWINSISVAEHSVTTTTSPSPSTLVVQDASIDWTTIGGFDPNPTEDPSVGRAYMFAANTIPQYNQIAWYQESFSAPYYGIKKNISVASLQPTYDTSVSGLITAPLGPTITETKMTGTDRLGGSFDLLWGSVSVATSPPTAGDCNMTGGNVSSSGGSMGVTGTAVYKAHVWAGVYRTYSVTRSVQIPTLSVPTGLPDGSYTGTVSGYAFAQLPQWLVWSSTADWQQVTASMYLKVYVMHDGVLGAPADFLGPTVTSLVAWSQSGSFTVTNGAVQVPGRTVNITQSCPCYARIGPYMFVINPQSYATSPPTNETVWNEMAARSSSRWAMFTASGVSRSVPLYKGYFVSTISLSR